MNTNDTAKRREGGRKLFGHEFHELARIPKRVFESVFIREIRVSPPFTFTH
jgi:hypothetical protein